MALASEGVSTLDAPDLDAGPRRGSVLMRPVEAVSAVLLTLIVALLFTGVVSRYVFHRPIIWIDEVASISFLWLAMLGSAIAIDRAEHLRLTIFLTLMPESWRPRAETLALVLMATFLGALVWPAIDYAIEESWITSAALNIPLSWRVSAIPFGIALMLVLVLTQIWRKGTPLQALGAIAFVAAVAAALWFAGPNLRSLGNLNILLFLVGFVAFFLVLGVPIAFCFGLGTLASWPSRPTCRSSSSSAAWTRACPP